MRYFLSLARLGSVTKAAEQHRISPAAFSKAMKVFEAEFGRRITVPHGRGIRLTEDALELVPKLDAIVRAVDDAKAPRDVSSEPRPLRIATFEVFSTHFMAKAMNDVFHKRGCELLELAPGKMEEAVADRSADLAITYLPVPRRGLDFLKICDVEMGLFGDPRMLQDSAYGSAPFAVPRTPLANAPERARGLDGWPDGAFPRNVRYRVSLMETALCLCADGLAIAYFPKFVAKLWNARVGESSRLRALPLPAKFPTPRLSAWIAKRASEQEGKDEKRVAMALRKICR